MSYNIRADSDALLITFPNYTIVCTLPIPAGFAHQNLLNTNMSISTHTGVFKICLVRPLPKLKVGRTMQKKSHEANTIRLCWSSITFFFAPQQGLENIH